MNLLEVTFIDELYSAEPGQVLSFGREADLVLDEQNLFMHRRVGRFVYHNEIWWLTNVGRRIDLVVTVGAAVVELPPGESIALTAAGGAVKFEAGAIAYELEYSVPTTLTFTVDREIEAADADADNAGTVNAADAGLTEDFAVISLNTEQRMLLAMLCEDRLRDPTSRAAVAPNAEMANRLGWSAKKFDRKLDYLCSRLSDQGVRGVRGGRGLEATARRAALIEHALRNEMVTADDLGLLDEPDTS